SDWQDPSLDSFYPVHGETPLDHKNCIVSKAQLSGLHVVAPSHIIFTSSYAPAAVSPNSRSTVSAVVSPFRDPVGPPSNSIHPSLNPSSMRIRGYGLRIPCARNSVSHEERGTA